MKYKPDRAPKFITGLNGLDCGDLERRAVARRAALDLRTTFDVGGFGARGVFIFLALRCFAGAVGLAFAGAGFVELFTRAARAFAIRAANSFFFAAVIGFGSTLVAFKVNLRVRIAEVPLHRV